MEQHQYELLRGLHGQVLVRQKARPAVNSLWVDSNREMVVDEKEERTKQVNTDVAPAISSHYLQ